MAQKVQVLMVSDLSGTELGTEGQTVKFGWLGVDFEIDVSQEEADQFAKDIDKYVSAARRVGGRKQAGSRSTPRAGMDPEQAKAIRAWASENGMKVSSRGRISQEVQDAYQKALSAS